MRLKRKEKPCGAGISGRTCLARMHEMEASLHNVRLGIGTGIAIGIDFGLSWRLAIQIPIPMDRFCRYYRTGYESGLLIPDLPRLTDISLISEMSMEWHRRSKADTGNPTMLK